MDTREHNIRTHTVGPWEFLVSSQPYRLSAEATRRGIHLLGQWARQFPLENTWVQRFNVPSLIVRFDGVLQNESWWQLYEIEDRPAGIGVSCSLNPTFKEKLAWLIDTLPADVVVVRSPNRSGGDDHLWTQVVGRPEDVGDRLALVRAELREKEYHSLRSSSISTITTEGNKSYGVHMDLWRSVRNPNELPWDRRFVLKPLQGTQMRNLHLWLCDRSATKRWGGSTRTKITKTLRALKAMYLQEFVPPMDSGLPEYPCMILRVFFFYDLAVSSSWKCLGGFWNARNSFRIHGAPDTVFGPVIPPDNLREA